MRLFVAASCLLAAASGIAVCPGEIREDYKCDHDDTHRVCAKLMDGSKEISWGAGTFWEITGQDSWAPDITSPPNAGNSWCICMWATAELIVAAGCDNVHLNCSATDVEYVMSAYSDSGTDLSPAHACLKSKCGSSGSLTNQKAAPRQHSIAAVVAPEADEKPDVEGGSAKPCDACSACAASCFTVNASLCSVGSCTGAAADSYCWSLNGTASDFAPCFGDGGNCGLTAPSMLSSAKKEGCKRAASASSARGK